MTRDDQSLVPCRECGRGYPFTTLHDHPDGTGYICDDCYGAYLDALPYDEEAI